MALIKTDNEIERMKKSGALLSRALQAAVDAVGQGVKMNTLDEIARGIIEAGGGKPSFLGYKGGGSVPFPASICASINYEVVHGVGTRNIELKEGDIIGLDLGCILDGMYTDMAATVPVGGISKERMDLLRVTRQSMYSGVEAVKVDGLISDIGAAVEDSVDSKKYGIVKALVGHGVGNGVHERPQIPNYRSDSFPIVKIQKGMCLAIEPMVTLGTHEIETAEDQWTVITKDKSDAAHFEVTIVVTDNGAEIITPQPEIKI